MEGQTNGLHLLIQTSREQVMEEAVQLARIPMPLDVSLTQPQIAKSKDPVGELPVMNLYVLVPVAVDANVGGFQQLDHQVMHSGCLAVLTCPCSSKRSSVLHTLSPLVDFGGAHRALACRRGRTLSRGRALGD